MWDYIASQRHDITLSNSLTTAKRLKKYFRLESQVLYPPIETKRFAKELQNSFDLPTSQPYYIILSALTEFKKIDIAIQNFRDISEISLVIIGDGEYGEVLKKQAQ